MQYRKIMSMLLILVLVAPWLAPAGKVSAGASYPVPGNNGLITVKGVDDNSVEVKWEYAQSDNTASHELSYRVFFSQNSDLTDANEINNSSVDHAYGNWISGSESTDGSFSRIVTNLTEGETYYFNVIVQDRYSDFAYQMQSIKFTTPLGEFNNAIGQNFDAAKIAELFKNENFITTTPDFESLPLEEQNALVTLAGHMNEPANGYQSNSEVQFLVDYIQEGISVMKVNELSDVQERLTAYYEKTLIFAASVSPEYLNMIKPMLDRYFMASDLERNVLAFKIKLQRIANNSSLEESVMNLSLASSQIINFTNASTQSEMINALMELYQLQEQAEAFKGTDKETLVGTFPLDFSKMKSISSDMTEMEKLTDWMLLKKPGNGYLTYKAAQETFDEFFGTPEKQSLKQLNAAIVLKDKVTVLSILKNTDLLNHPGAFSELTDQEQKTVAATLVQMTPRSGSYNEDQVQFIVDISINILLRYRLDYRDMASALNNIYDQVIVKGANLFSEEEFEQFKRAADFYLKSNQADQQLIAYIAKFTSVAMDTESAVGLMFTLSEEFPSINQAETASEILNNLNLYQMLQMQYQILLANNPGLSLQEPL
ncbi:fibronectin type III domain-containing protein [Paenibacillus sp. OVF10]|nr:fibronectin type III domain-containing protein [Paenibacillus sp. OVF10]